MFDFVQFGSERLQTFLLIILRVSGLFILAPVWGHRGIPQNVKLGLIILLASILTATISQPMLPLQQSVWGLAGLAAKEILVGIIIGLFFAFIFMAVQLGGALVGYQLGLAVANVFDPSTQTQIPIIGSFWTMVTLLMFIAFNGHHLIIGALVDSYRVIPVGNIDLYGSAGELLIKYSGYVFIIALKIAAPVMVCVFLVDISLGLVAKTMPTMNVFFVGFPIKISVGLVVLALSMPMVSYVLEKMMTFLDSELRVMFLAMGKA